MITMDIQAQFFNRRSDLCNDSQDVFFEECKVLTQDIDQCLYRSGAMDVRSYLDYAREDHIYELLEFSIITHFNDLLAEVITELINH